MAVKFISNELIYAVGSTLVHSLWQGVVVGIILAIALLLIPRKNAQLKYWMAITALTGIVIWGGYTFNKQMALKVSETHMTNSQALPSFQFYANLEGPRSLVLTVQHYLQQVVGSVQPFMPTMVVLWMLGVLFLLLRLQGSIMYLGRLKRTKVSRVPADWSSKLEELSHQLGIPGPVSMMESALAEIPMVIGHLKPVILLPLGMIAGLPARDVEAVLAHELAHIKRYDYLINIVQTVVESVLFFNPVVWWVSSVIRKQREHCCDDLAVRCCGNQLVYAHALTNLGAWSLKSPSMSMGLFKNRNELFQRIKRLVYPHAGASIKEKWVPAGILVLTLTCLTWYSHKVQAQLVPQTDLHERAALLDLNINDPSEPVIQEFPLDTIPEPPEDQEELPPMEPTEQASDYDYSYNFYLDFDPPIDIDIDIPPLPPFEIDMAHLQGALAGLDALVDLPNEAVIWEMEDLDALMKGIRPQLSDTTRKKITEALESQREALEKAREEQAKAFEKAKEQLRQSLDQDRPQDLTDEEWELAKERIRSAERSLDRAMEQSHRALERALQEREKNMDVHLEETHRSLRDQERMAHEQVQRYQRDRERVEREHERARQHEARADRRQRNENMLRDALVEDDLISRHDDDLHLFFKNDIIKINGHKLQGDLKEKYRDILDEIYGSNSSGELHYQD